MEIVLSKTSILSEYCWFSIRTLRYQKNQHQGGNLLRETGIDSLIDETDLSHSAHTGFVLEQAVWCNQHHFLHAP